MRTRKNTKKVAKAPAKAKPITVNLNYVDDIMDDAMTTHMAIRAIVHTQADEIARLRKRIAELEGRK